MSHHLPDPGLGSSIYGYICAHLDPAGRLVESGLVLPDEEEPTGGVKFAAGALDGVVGHNFGGVPQEKAAGAAVRRLQRAARKPSARNLKKLYELLTSNEALDFVDPMIQQLHDAQTDREALHRIGCWLATTSADRNPVKVGIALLGATGVEPDVAVVRALGGHEEFTLYASVAFMNGLADPESELWALASSVEGWGRIQCVEHLRDTNDPAIRSWILREGFRNDVMYEYLAYIAATAGGLLEALRRDDVDRELLRAAGEILGALVADGPAEDLDDYEEGAEAVEAFLGHMAIRAEDLYDFHAVDSIRRWLTSDGDWEARSHRGWTATRRETFEATCSTILDRKTWADLIEVGLLSDDTHEFWQAETAARIRGIDTFDTHLGRIEADPLAGPWFQAWEQADHDRAEVLAEIARTRLPLDEIAGGPANELGLGQDWKPHQALDWTLQALRDHVGVGPDLVLVGLSSPVTRNRNMSLNVLKQWPEESWPEGARALAEGLAVSDPNEGTREFAGATSRLRPGSTMER